MGGNVKIAQFSDLHYANETLGEVDRCFAAAIERAVAWGAQAAVISGDCTDHKLDVHSPAFITLARRVREISNHCPVLMLQGTFSHEPPGTLDIFSLVDGKHPVFVADRFCQVALYADRWHAFDGWCATESELASAAMAEALFTCVPSANKAAVAGALGASDAGEALGEQLAHLLRGYGLANEAARAAGIPTVGVSHGTVSGCETEQGVPMVGLDHEFTTGALFAAQCSAFMLGHIHKHQDWKRTERAIAYAGSVGRLHYGEVDPKGCLLWTVDAERASFEFCETPARRMIHLDFAGLPQPEELERVAKECEGAFVRVRWNVDEEHRHQVDRTALETMLGTAAQVKLEPHIVPIVRSRAEGMNHTDSDPEKLTMWCQVTDTPSEGLAERLELLAHASPEDIASRIVGGNVAAAHSDEPSQTDTEPEDFSLTAQ